MAKIPSGASWIGLDLFKVGGINQNLSELVGLVRIPLPVGEIGSDLFRSGWDLKNKKTHGSFVHTHVFKTGMRVKQGRQTNEQKRLEINFAKSCSRFVNENNK